MKTGISAIALTLSLLGLGACSSTDGDEPAAAHTPAPSSATPASEASPAVRMRDGAGQWTSCVPYTRSEGDFLWTGVRLTADADATLVGVGAEQANGVHIIGAWVAEAEHAAGAFVPWSEGDEFLGKMDWAHRRNANGARLSAGSKYSLVLRLRPDARHLPVELTEVTIDWKAADGSGSLTNDTVLQFATHC